MEIQRRTLVASCGLFAVSCLVGTSAASAQKGKPHIDRIFLNGNIWTGDDGHPRAEGLAISGDKIVAVGAKAEIKALANADTSMVDLHGRLVVPGFQDSHLHFPGASVNEVDLHGAETLQEFQRRLAEFAKAHPNLPWITGQGWGYSAFPGQRVDKKYIDAVISDRPVYVTERDGHMGLANSKALEVSGVTSATPDPPNGHIMKEAGGQPTGEFKEAAQSIIESHVPARTEEDLYQSLLQHMDEAAAAGLTAAQDAYTDMAAFPVFERALAADQLKLRFRFAPGILPSATGGGGAPKDHKLKEYLTSADLESYRKLRETFPGPMLKFGAVKGVLDGTVDARTAAMFEPYVGGGKGIPFWEQDDLNKTVALYDKEGFQVLLHAIGDKAINMALNAFEYAAKTNSTTGRRHRVEHAEVPLLSDLARFKQLGVIASTQAMFANPDATVLENFAVLLGPERASHADSFKIYDDAGVVQAFGSDWGVFAFEPLPAIYCVVTRTTPEGSPSGGWYPAGRISVEAALRHFTRDGAYASFDEDIRGTLSPGKLADLVVLSKDILTIPAPEILKTKVLLTVMGGRDTFRAAEFDGAATSAK
ncbi:MAG TPA: amidohydrolase [Candidatus Acidoferrum sp.]|nr:amidohydrolase [Candidatus Acidoferrum sp.]